VHSFCCPNESRLGEASLSTASVRLALAARSRAGLAECMASVVGSAAESPGQASHCCWRQRASKRCCTERHQPCDAAICATRLEGGFCAPVDLRTKARHRCLEPVNVGAPCARRVWSGVRRLARRHSNSPGDAVDGRNVKAGVCCWVSALVARRGSRVLRGHGVRIPSQVRDAATAEVHRKGRPDAVIGRACCRNDQHARCTARRDNPGRLWVGVG
jgi:hypothetical protein